MVATLLAGCHAVDVIAIGADGSAPGGANVLLNAGCEEGTSQWNAWQGTLSTVSPGRSGAFACEVCTRTDVMGSTLDANQGTNDVSMPVVGSTWIASAWVRASPGTTGAISWLSVREWEAFGSVIAGSGSPESTLSDTTWTLLEVTHTVVGTNDFVLDAYVAQAGQPGDCFLIDDLSLAQR